MEMVAMCKSALFGEKGLFYPGSLAAFKKGWQDTAKACKKSNAQKVGSKVKQNAKVQARTAKPILVTNSHPVLEEEVRKQDIPNHEQLPPEILWDIAEDEALDEYL